ncbi:MAG: NAD(P)H-dependent oxidoreductase [Candidatus Gracilibacteria bacterium]
MSNIENLEWRYATKRYDTTKKLTPDQLNMIKESLRLSPSSFGLQAWKFVHVADPALRQELAAAAWNQPQVTEASDLFVLASYVSIDEAFVDKFVASVAETRGISVDVLQGYRDMMVGSVKGRTPEQLGEWLARQVYIPLGVALTVAADNHIDASPMEGFDSQKFNELLGLDKLNLCARTILAVGFRSPEDETQNMKKSRFSQEEVFIER